MDQRDLGRWLLALLCRAKPGQAYNVGSEEAVTVAEIAQIVRDTLAPAKSVIIASTQRNDLRSKYVPSTRKARDELGVDLMHPLTESIRETAKHAKKPAEEQHRLIKAA